MRTVGTALVVLALFGAATVAEDNKVADKKPKKKFTVGKDTTYVTGPRDKDGYIDYSAALNKRLGQGVTPANNAVVLIWKAVGPRPEGSKGMPPEFFKLLGIPQLAEKGDYFIGLSRYLEDHLKIPREKAANDLLEQFDKACLRPWKATEYPAIASWLQSNRKPIALLIEATERSRSFSPLPLHRAEKGLQGIIAAVLPAAKPCRELASALAARAMLRLGHKDVDGAWRDLLACHRLGRLVARGSTLIKGLVGLAINQVACRADLGFLDRVTPDAKTPGEVSRRPAQAAAPAVVGRPNRPRRAFHTPRKHSDG